MNQINDDTILYRFKDHKEIKIPSLLLDQYPSWELSKLSKGFQNNKCSQKVIETKFLFHRTDLIVDYLSNHKFTSYSLSDDDLQGFLETIDIQFPLDSKGLFEIFYVQQINRLIRFFSQNNIILADSFIDNSIYNVENISLKGLDDSLLNKYKTLIFQNAISYDLSANLLNFKISLNLFHIENIVFINTDSTKNSIYIDIHDISHWVLTLYNIAEDIFVDTVFSIPCISTISGIHICNFNSLQNYDSITLAEKYLLKNINELYLEESCMYMLENDYFKQNSFRILLLQRITTVFLYCPNRWNTVSPLLSPSLSFLLNKNIPSLSSLTIYFMCQTYYPIQSYDILIHFIINSELPFLQSLTVANLQLHKEQNENLEVECQKKHITLVKVH
ncbi:hypothetical protein WA158_001208 [Blastocystis sp. Blastoise]